VSEVVIKSTENGPNLVVVDGKVVQAWCRCGGSTLMPFCDGTHKKNGFTAKAREVQVGQGN
jgi:CDGSH-type Zn-finger protein